MTSLQHLKLPPGPRGIPILGYLPFIIKEGGLGRVAAKYGEEHKTDVVLIDSLIGKIVIINSFELIKEVFQTRDTLATRTRTNVFTKFHAGHQGFIFSNGDLSREHRAFAMHAMKNAGIGKMSVEKILREEVGYFLRDLEATNENPTNSSDILTHEMQNVLCSFMFGKRYDHDDEELVFLEKGMEMVTDAYPISFIMSPWMWYLPRFLDVLGIQAHQRNVDSVLKFIADKIKARKDEYDPDDIKCYIDAYLLCGKQGKESFTDFQLTCEIFDLMFASGVTVRGAMLWAFNWMARFPEIQERVQRELDNKVGRDRLPAMADKVELPYTNAVLMEVLRMAHIAGPETAFHTDDHHDLEIGGYKVPKGSLIAPNIYWVNHNPDIWMDPDHFNPNNFFNEDDGTVKPSEKLIAFGYGHRACVGYHLANTAMFLIFTNCLHRFRLECDDLPKDEPVIGGPVELPTPFQVRFRKRN